MLVRNTVAQRQFFINIPLLADQHHISDMAKWRWGGGGVLELNLL